MTPKTDIDHLIILCLNNRATELQKRELEEWINVSNANKDVFEHIKILWSKPTAAKLDQKMKRKRDEIWLLGTAGEVKKSPAANSIDLNYWGKIAATFFIALLSFWIVYQSVFQNGSPSAVTTAIIQKENPAGQRSMHMLSDGTQVWLNTKSSLTFSEVFSDTIRLVKLTGEAFFEVARDRNRPFIVETSTTKTQALGTAFNIQAYAEDELVRVSLLEGKVKVQGRDELQTSVLSPGEELLISKNGAEFSIHNFKYEKTFGWKQGILLFDGVDFKTFCAILEKWYGVKTKVLGTPHTDWNIRARYKNESLQYVMRDISFNKNFIFELNDKELIINFNEKPMI